MKPCTGTEFGWQVPICNKNSIINVFKMVFGDSLLYHMNTYTENSRQQLDSTENGHTRTKRKLCYCIHCMWEICNNNWKETTMESN